MLKENSQILKSKNVLGIFPIFFQYICFLFGNIPRAHHYLRPLSHRLRFVFETETGSIRPGSAVEYRWRIEMDGTVSMKKIHSETSGRIRLYTYKLIWTVNRTETIFFSMLYYSAFDMISVSSGDKNGENVLYRTRVLHTANSIVRDFLENHYAFEK